MGTFLRHSVYRNHGVTRSKRFYLSLIGHIGNGNVLKLCSQRTYLLKLFRDQGLQRHYLNTVFDALVGLLSRLRYAIPTLSGF